MMKGKIECKHFLVVLALIVCMLISYMSPALAANRGTDVTTPDEGNVFVVVSGKYSSATKKDILNRINAIRLEACQKGYINPNTGEKLTKSDYVPIKWSSDLEWIAQLRAAEATVYQSHMRPNGKDCFSVTHNEQSSWAENLAWNWSGMMEGIEDWYAEKDDWVKQSGAVTGHYTSLINPAYQYIGLGTFEDTKNGGWITTAGEFSFEEGLDETKSSLSGSVKQYIEVPYSSLSNLKIADHFSIEKGKNKQLSLSAQVNFSDVYGYTTQQIPNEDITWKSSNTSVAKVSQSGYLTTSNYGKTTIYATYKGKTYSCVVTVTRINISGAKVSSISHKTYNGKQQKPNITVKYGNTTLKKNTDYKVSYDSNKNVGKGTIKITGIGKYTGSKTVTFQIVPKNTSISKLTAKSKGFKVTWKKQTTQTTGYQIQYSTSSQFKNAKTVTISKNKTTSRTVTKLSKKKKYYVRIRTYKTINKTKYYSSWSKAKTVTTKK